MLAGEKIIQLSPDAWIALPDLALDAKLTPVADPSTVATEMATQDDFHLLRVIGDLKIFGREQTYFVFKPPARLQVRLTPDDLNRAQRRGRPLALAYWYEGRWVRLPYGNLPAAPDAAGDNWAYFIIEEMPDPPVAWGT